MYFQFRKKPIPLLPEELRGLTMAPYPVPPEIPNYRKFADDLIAAPEDTDELVEGDCGDGPQLCKTAKPTVPETPQWCIPMQNPKPAWHPAKSIVPV